MVDEKETHTFSYYGFLNKFGYNLGYHREHHDFPTAPGRYLPPIKKLARSFYLEEDKRHVVTSIVSATLKLFFAEPGHGLSRHSPKFVSWRKRSMGMTDEPHDRKYRKFLSYFLLVFWISSFCFLALYGEIFLNPLSTSKK